MKSYTSIANRVKHSASDSFRGVTVQNKVGKPLGAVTYALQTGNQRNVTRMCEIKDKETSKSDVESESRISTTVFNFKIKLNPFQITVNTHIKMQYNNKYDN